MVEDRGDDDTAQFGHQAGYVTRSERHREDGQGHGHEGRETAEVGPGGGGGLGDIVMLRSCAIFRLLK